MACGTSTLGVVYLGLLLSFALVDARAARPKRQASNLVGQGAGASSGNLCQPLGAPAKATIACGSGFPFYSCTAMCDPGYQFPNGLTYDKRECDQMYGEWFDPPGKNIPDCVPICSPACQNGGSCVLPNTCSCVNGFMGKECEYPPSNCASPPNPTNGQVSCTHDASGATCTSTCNQGYKPMWNISPAYKCSPDGTWSPPLVEIPNCVPQSAVINTTHVPIAAVHSGTGSSRCVAWGQDHYRTFDNKVFHYKGKCQYILVKETAANTFNIQVKNDKTCQPGHRCKRELEIFIGNDVISMKREASGPVVQWNGAPVAIPSNKNGIVFEKVSHYTIVRSSLGFTIRWDGYEMVFVTITDDLKGKTEGLCGTYDHDQTNDFKTDSGSVVQDAASFATTWKRTAAGETCGDSVQTGCSTQILTVQQQAQTKCDGLKSQAFQACHAAVDPNPYIAACKEDCCSSQSSDCTCSSFEAYSRACMDANIQLTWRTAQLCPVQCANNQIHKECGSMCQRTCQSTAAHCDDHACIDGCFCPDGMVLHNDTCVDPVTCPCVSNGKEYKGGEEIQRDCNKCTCNSGQWQCTNKRCEATCSAIGDPHYMTFDGKRFDYMGVCSYYMVYDPNFDIIANNIKCGHGDASCTKSVTIDIGGHTITLDHNHDLFIDNNRVTKLPYEKDFIKIYMVSSLFMKAELSNGISVLWDGRTRVYITAPPEFINKTMGLCGTFDFNQKNDFKTKQGDIETNINAFGNRWKTQPSCQDVALNHTNNPCEDNAQRKNQSNIYCSYLKSDIFKACNDVVDVEGDYQSCMYDLCACEQNLKDCLCPTLATYAQTCAAAGVHIQWRQQVPECRIPCPGGQEYQVCPNECTRTCSNIANDPTCVQSGVCAEGCGCPANQTLNDNGDCIDVAMCPCKFNGQDYSAGTTVERGDQVCTCVSARWTCAPKPAGSSITGLAKICPDDQEYSSCISNCPETCDNSAPACNQTKCTEGCVCKPGLVRLGDKCVLKTECPCFHGGVAYKEGEKFTMDCNECTCRNQVWICENKDCPAICSAFGDSHYQTFDGKSFDFQGNCDYILVQSKPGNPVKFQITTENIPCGTTGTTCTKSISFTIGEPATANYYELQLVKGKSVRVDPNSPFHVKEVGNFVIITTPQGITLEWDRGTRVYVKLKSEQKGQVFGLCGDFDGNQRNDFSSPQGGSVARPTAFADTWKVHGYCGASKEVTGTCETNPGRHGWAQQECAIISSKLFEPCHGVVAYKEYLDKCIFDACACDTGGDCECLCTVVAAYAHQCAMNGVSIKWRTPDFCAIQCEDCYTYNPCISICPRKTCDNRLVYDTLTQDCGKETCVEGCDIEPCAPGQVFESDKTPLKCIPEAFCNQTCLTINGISYKEGERIVDGTVCRMDCEICYCNNNQVKRTGVCSSTISPPPLSSQTPTMAPYLGVTGTPTPAPLPAACTQSGPTNWMSVSTPTPYNQGDMETIPSLRQKYTFCDISQMTAMECRVVGTSVSAAASGQQVTCDLRNGLRCNHADQTGGPCYNYEVRFTCDCG